MQYAEFLQMTLADKIRLAFADRKKPAAAVDMTGRMQIDSDVEEALWFTGRKWQDITWKDWQEHSAGITFFSKDAFAYYLPSVLLVSLQNPTDVLDAADSVVWNLDRTPNPEGWNDLFIEHFVGLRSDEYEVIKEWLLEVCDYPAYKRYGNASAGPGDSFGRAYDTVALLQRESVRH